MEKMIKTQIVAALEQLPGWPYDQGSITKTFTFKNFREAFSAMTRIAFECEGMDHHPDWRNVYNTLEVALSTHDAGGVTQKDFDLAQRIEKILIK